MVSGKEVDLLALRLFLDELPASPCDEKMPDEFCSICKKVNSDVYFECQRLRRRLGLVMDSDDKEPRNIEDIIRRVDEKLGRISEEEKEDVKFEIEIKGGSAGEEIIDPFADEPDSDGMPMIEIVKPSFKQPGDEPSVDVDSEVPKRKAVTFEKLPEEDDEEEEEKEDGMVFELAEPVEKKPEKKHAGVTVESAEAEVKTAAEEDMEVVEGVVVEEEADDDDEEPLEVQPLEVEPMPMDDDDDDLPDDAVLDEEWDDGEEIEVVAAILEEDISLSPGAEDLADEITQPAKKKALKKKAVKKKTKKSTAEDEPTPVMGEPAEVVPVKKPSLKKRKPKKTTETVEVWEVGSEGSAPVARDDDWASGAGPAPKKTLLKKKPASKVKKTASPKVKKTPAPKVKKKLPKKKKTSA